MALILSAPRRRAAVQRLFDFEIEIEREIAKNAFADQGVRDAVSIARGKLELARNYGTPIDAGAVERALARASLLIGSNQWRRDFLVRLRMAGAWVRLESEAAT